MTIITVEVEHFHPSSVEATPAKQTERLRELQAHHVALQEIFLGPHHHRVSIPNGLSEEERSSRFQRGTYTSSIRKGQVE
jgi:hypothetical protein